MRDTVIPTAYRFAPAAFAAIAIFAPQGAAADTLADAISQTYRTSPALQAQRASLRITDENYVQARAGYRPQASVQASATRQDFQQQTTNSGSAALVASQPIYTGGRTAAAISAAEADILAGRETLRQAEAGVLQSVIQAYADTLRDQEGVTIREQNLAALNDQLKEVQARAKVGDLTRTDMAQSQGYVAQARIDLANARAQLEISQANYRQVVGTPPGQLAPLPALPNMPANLNQAFATAEAGNPGLRSSQYTEQGARQRIAQARSQRMPTVSLQAQFGYSGPVSSFLPNVYGREVLATATITQPLFAGGVISSQIRQQVEQETTARLQVEQSRRVMIQQLSQSWAQFVAARDNIGNAEESVGADEVAYEGVQKERRAGLRSTLEVLSIEQSLRDAELVRSAARHDTYVLAAQVLDVMGLLEAKLLVPGIEPYSPERSFKAVRNQGSVPWEAVPALLDNIGGSQLHHLPPAPQAPLPAG